MGVQPAPDADVAAIPPMSGSELRAWRAFAEGGQLIATLLDRRLKDHLGVSHADFGVLRRLQDSQGHRLSMRDLRHEVWFSRSRLTHQINRLEANGLVVKTADADDGRRQIVALTPVGLETVADAQRMVRRLLRQHFFDQLPLGSVEVLAQALEQMNEHLRTQPECQLYRHS